MTVLGSLPILPFPHSHFLCIIVSMNQSFYGRINPNRYDAGDSRNDIIVYLAVK